MTKKYNFAIFGLPRSGKTCLLAALDMQRIEHPAGYTCSLLPVKIKKPLGVSWTDAEKEAEILHKSSAQLEKAKELIEQGALPEKTELSIDFIFDYKFSSQQTGEFQARLIDYGGELVLPQNAPLDMAKELREKFQSADGLFVLAPAPLKGSEQLNKLQKTMGLIEFSNPIALLITKWDRQQTITCDELPSAEHRDLYNHIINKVGKENCQIFPVSAFGKCNTHETESPKQANPLPSIGLLDSFIWVAQRIESIQSQNDTALLQNYEQAVANYKKWLPYPSLVLWKLKRQGKKIVRRFPKKSEKGKRARKARLQASLTWWSRLLVFVPLIVIIPLTLLSGRQAYLDKKNYAEVHRTLNHPDAKLDDIKKAEQWLENYYYIAPLSHPLSWLFVVTNGTAKSELNHSRNLREQRFWQTIQDAPSIEKKLQIGKTYLKMIANGRHISEVQTIVEKAEETLRQKREQQWWQQIEQAPTETTKLEAAYAYLKNISNGEHQAEVENIIVQIEETLHQKKEQHLWEQVKNAQSRLLKLTAARHYQTTLPDGKHQGEIKNIIAQIEEALAEEDEQRLWQPVLNANTSRTKKEAAQTYLQNKPDGKYAPQAKLLIAQANEVLHEEWDQFTKDYYDLYNDGWFLEAVQHLSQKQFQNEPQLQTLKQQFTANIFNSLNEYIESLIEARQWSDAYKKLDNYNHWPDDYKQGDDQIRALRHKVETAQDHHLYTEFLENQDIERVNNYLSYAPLQTMRNKVEEYKKYLIDIQNPLELTLIFERIKWGNFSDDGNIVTVYMDSEKIIQAASVEAIANTSSGEIGRKTFTKKLNDEVTIEVDIVEKNWLTDYDKNGEGNYTGKVDQLKKGKTLELRSPKDDFTNHAVFRLEGIPNPPDLPDWGD